MQLTDNIDYIKQAIAQQELKKLQAQQAPQAQDIGGIPAQMQNVGAQQANQNAALAEGQKIANVQSIPASQPNMGLAMALRKDKKKKKNWQIEKCQILICALP